MSLKYTISIIGLSMIVFGCGLVHEQHISLITTTDEYTGVTEISVSSVPSLRSINGFSQYTHYLMPIKRISERESVSYLLHYQKTCNQESLYPITILFLIDGKRVRLEFDGSNSESSFSSGGHYYCTEWAWVKVEKSFFENIAYSSDVRLRVVGSSNSIEYKFDDNYMNIYRLFYDGIRYGETGDSHLF